MELNEIVNQKINDFYDRLIESSINLNIKNILKKKNPYLYKALGIKTGEELTKEILKAHSISSYEGIFGDAFFEPLAKEIANGYKSVVQGIDITIVLDDKNQKAYAIKSGPNVFNASSRKEQKKDFMNLKSRLRGTNIDCVVGYGYGKKMSNESSGAFREVSGQALWTELTGREDAYIEIAEFDLGLIEEKMKIYNDELKNSLKKHTEVLEQFLCYENGEINWYKWFNINSGLKAKEFDVKLSKKTIVAGESVDVTINAKLENTFIKQYDEKPIYFEDKDLEIEIINLDEDISLKVGEYVIENEKITVFNNIKEKKKLKILFSYRGKRKTVTINIKPDLVKK